MSRRANPGRILSRLRGTIGIPGRCARWGCLLPVGPGSTFGEGPVCFVCQENLRPTPRTEENESWKNTPESP